MNVDLGSIDHLSQVISQVVAPSFLLGAVASFLSILLGRMKDVLDRLRTLNALNEGEHPHAHIKADIPRQKRRASLLNKAVNLAILSGLATTVLIIVAFFMALIGVSHQWFAAILFMVALGLLFASLTVFAVEIKIGLSEFDHY